MGGETRGGGRHAHPERGHVFRPGPAGLVAFPYLLWLSRNWSILTYMHTLVHTGTVSPSKSEGGGREREREIRKVHNGGVQGAAR